MTSLRQPYAELSGPALQHLRAIKKLLEDSPLGRNLVELVYLRVSQRNGCAFCLDMHARHCAAAGKALSGWIRWPAGA